MESPPATPVDFIVTYRIRLFIWMCLVCLANHVPADEATKFVYGINLNGPAVVIDGQQWQGADSPNYVCRDKAFENQSVKLTPATDAARAKMIRSSRWGGNRIELHGLSAGLHTLFLYVWEDNNSESYDVLIDGRAVQRGYKSGSAGHWDRLGPWHVDVKNDSLLVESRGGAANFSGIEIWQGKYAGEMTSEPSPEDLAFFEQRIRPVLVNRCYECHAVDAKEVGGELLVDSRQALRRGGSNGPALVPGDVDSSLLVKAIRYRDANLQMPPGGRLPDNEISDFQHWISRGAADPRTTATKFARPTMDITEGKKFWSFQPLKRPDLPMVQHQQWPTSPIDHFVLAKMEEHGFAPGPDAERRAWLRRATFDLIGLPPTIEEVDNFLSDASSEAYARVIDRLLESPRYGERWGRYWLDVVRYADTAGDNSDFPIPQMYLYRDWVIKHINDDLPYDQFVAMQLAGDLLPARDQHERRQNLIATGYIANSRRFGSRVDDYPQHLTIEDTLDNFGRAFLGLSINCARCHDHKFDPLSMQDYYGLYGIFDSTRYPWPGIELEQRQRDLVALASDEEVRAFLDDKTQKQTLLDDEVKRLDKLHKAASGDEKLSLDKELKAAKDQARDHSQIEPTYELLYAVADKLEPADATIQLKGDPAKPGDIAARKFPAILGGQELPTELKTSGRLQLVQWLFDPSNPLPARVMVNRIWQYHFGKGLVPTANDFGKQGKAPTHPELLDYLATQFIADGWSIKTMHRRIMLSRTYRLATRSTVPDGSMRGAADATAREAVAAADPNNDWLTAFDRRRLDAEALRDTLLQLGDTLDLSPAGAHPFPPQRQWKFTQHNPFKAEYASSHRSVYLMTQRIQRHSFLAIFDGADPSVSTPRRSSTTTPLQSLYLLNDQVVHEQALKFAERLLRLQDQDKLSDDQLVKRAFEWCFSRPANDWEVAQALKHIMTIQSRSNVAGNEARLAAWQSLARVMFRLNEFVYVD